jgi:hypothetical protein
MRHIRNTIINIIFAFIVISFVVFYPMLISIYVFIPLMIGFMGYIMIKGINERKILYILTSFVYIINLELNLSLPIFLILISILLVYVILYNLGFFDIKCGVCKALLSVLFIDFLYLALLMGYDFFFQIESIVVDELLFYSLLVDLIVVVVL